jgi:3-oxoacyl-[acyl-carrier protein] reductase
VGNFLVAGARTGIGASVKQMLQEAGHTVYTAGRQEAPGSAGHLVFDAALTGPVVLPDFWPDSFDGLVYAPGTINLKPFQRLTPADFEQDFRVNVLGFVSLMQAMLPRLKKPGSASVVVFSTVATQVGMSFHASVSAAKSALEGLALSLAAELAPSGIRVNAVAPSLTDTPLAASLLNSPEKAEASARRHPLQRIGQPGDPAGMAAFLCSPAASWISGQVFRVDGGLSSLR